jgi:parallel beta-helix repeat protein
MLTLAFNIQPVKAEGTIYIRADGSIDPPTAPILTVDNVTYTFTDNIYNDSIVVERSNIIVNGAGYMLQGAESVAGIYLGYKSNVTIKNTNIKGFIRGISLFGSSNNNIFGNQIATPGGGIGHQWCVGIELQWCSNNTIVGNNVISNRYGYGSGIELYDSSNNVLRNNIMTNHGFNFCVSGSILSHFVNDVDVSNTVNGKPVYYWINRRDLSVPVDAGCVVLINCTRIIAQKLKLDHNGFGVILAFTTNSTISNVNLISNKIGMILSHSSGNSMFGNNITENLGGIWLDKSSSNSVVGNGVRGGMTIDNITLMSTGGICLSESSANSIIGNIITNNEFGIGVDSSSNNSISGNNITANNQYGIYLEESSDNTIYHNNFKNNTKQVYDLSWDYPQYCFPSLNVWDDGYPSGGNYWSNYNGTDSHSGHYQNETGSDGIGDTSYIIDGNNTDRYPLMKLYPWGCDVNADGIVDISDILEVALRFGSTPGHTLWNPHCDIDNNGIVDISDILEVALHYGETDP